MNSGHFLITGGTGFIGSQVCQMLHAKGHYLTVLSRYPVRASGKLDARIRVIKGFEELDDAPPVQGLVNLCGEPLADRSWNEKRKALFYSSRVGVTEAMFEYFSESDKPPPKVLVSGSAIGYYGPHQDEVVDESADSVSCFSSELCRAWESMACQFQNLGTRVCRLRTGIVLGQGGALSRMLPAFRMGMGGPMGSGKQWMPWIHVSDMVNIVSDCLETPTAEGAYNATAPEPVTNKEFSKSLGRALSRPAVITLPSFIIRALFGEMGKELLLSGQRVVPFRLLDEGFEFSYPDLEYALKDVLRKL